MDSTEQDRQAQADQTAVGSSGTDAGSGTEEQGDGEPSVSSPTQLDTASDASGGLSKAKRKGKDDGTAEFASVLNSKISELEKGMGGSSMEREAAKLRRKQLREVQRYCTDKQNSAEDRITYVQGKYTALVTDFLKMEKHYIEVQKELELVTKERDKVQLELRKTNTLRDRLEELSRQLQRENKEVLEESRRRKEEEMKQRQALQQKFSQAINDVTVRMEQQQQDRAKQLEENEALRVKLGEVLQQFDSFSQLLHGKDLEVQLANAKLEQQQHLSSQLLAKAELLQQANENLSQANEVMRKELEHHLVIKEQNVLLHENNKELKSQIETYCDKFSDFQSTLTKSNEMFTTLKKEIDSSNKQRAQMVKEREEMRKRIEKSDQSLVMLLDENQGLKKKVQRVVQAMQGQAASDASLGDPADAVQKLRLQKERLEGLCRALQQKLKVQQLGEGAGETGQDDEDCRAGGSAPEVAADQSEGIAATAVEAS